MQAIMSVQSQQSSPSNWTRLDTETQYRPLDMVYQLFLHLQDATPYRPGKNGFCKQHNTKGSGPADNIYFFYQRLWPGQIANTKSSLTLALGLMHLNFYLFYWPLLKNIFSQQVLDSNLSDNDGGLVDNEDDQEKEDSPMITDNDFDFLSNFLFTMSVCLTSTHLEHSISFRSVSAL